MASGGRCISLHRALAALSKGLEGDGLETAKALESALEEAGALGDPRIIARMSAMELLTDVFGEKRFEDDIVNRVKDFIQDVSAERIMLMGRWRQESTLHAYIQEGRPIRHGTRCRRSSNFSSNLASTRTVPSSILRLRYLGRS